MEVTVFQGVLVYTSGRFGDVYSGMFRMLGLGNLSALQNTRISAFQGFSLYTNL